MRAGVFAPKDENTRLVIVRLDQDSATVRVVGAKGKYREPKKIKYSGKPIEFLITPELLLELTKKHTECVVSNNALLIEGGRYKYATRLGRMKESKGEKV